MSQINWFNSFMASVCLFLVFSLSTSALMSANTSLRFIDGRMGLLAQPITESVAWLGDQVKKGIIPFESISVQAQQAVSVVFSIEEVLQQLIASVVQSILNTIIALIQQVIDKLKDGIKQIGGVFEKLKELGAGFINSLQSLAAIKDILPQISDAAFRLVPTTTTSSGINNAIQAGVGIGTITAATVQNAVYTGLTNFATCQTIRDTQLELPANERSSVPDQATCDAIKAGITDVKTKADCGEFTGPLAGLLGVVTPCPVEVATKVDTEATNLAKSAKNLAKVKIDTNLAKATDGCKFTINKSSQVFADALANTNTDSIFSVPTNNGNYDFSNLKFSSTGGDAKFGVPAAQFTVPSPKECEYWRSGELATTAAALAADKSVPSVKDGGLGAIFQAFLQQVQQIVTDFVNDIVKFAQDLLNQFVNLITSIAGGIPVLGQYLSSITGSLSNVGAGLKNLANTGDFSLFGTTN
jgi:hypothetical protein